MFQIVVGAALIYPRFCLQTLLSYVEARHNDMTEEEVGQRILSALKRVSSLSV